MTLETIEYQTSGTCCAIIQVTLDDEVIKDVNFLGGCQGNLQGIKNLVIDMKVDDVISKLQGIRCGAKMTSCPDQLAKCLNVYKSKRNISV